LAHPKVRNSILRGGERGKPQVNSKVVMLQGNQGRAKQPVKNAPELKKDVENTIALPKTRWDSRYRKRGEGSQTVCGVNSDAKNAKNRDDPAP